MRDPTIFLSTNLAIHLPIWLILLRVSCELLRGGIRPSPLRSYEEVFSREEPLVYLCGVRLELLVEDEKERLREILAKMGCVKLLDMFWTFKSPRICREVYSKKIPKDFEKTLRG